MSLSADSIIDRIKLKEQIMRWRTGTIILAVLAVLLLITKQEGGNLVERNYIARITVEGLIQHNTERDQILKEIADNKHIKAVIVYINSPGGTMVGSELLYKRLRNLAAKKPVVAVMQEVAASGGYMAAIAANHILAQEGTITGSIGVLFQSAEVTEMAKKLGVTLVTFKSSPLKGGPSPLEKVTPDVANAVQALVKANYDIFVDIIQEARNMPKKTLLPLADGRVYTGLQAVENRLIDGIGGEEEAIAWLGKQNNKLLSLPVKEVKLYREKHSLENAFTSLLGWDKNPLSMNGIGLHGVLALWQASAL